MRPGIRGHQRIEAGHRRRHPGAASGQRSGRRQSQRDPVFDHHRNHRRRHQRPGPLPEGGRQRHAGAQLQRSLGCQAACARPGQADSPCRFRAHAAKRRTTKMAVHPDDTERRRDVFWRCDRHCSNAAAARCAEQQRCGCSDDLRGDLRRRVRPAAGSAAGRSDRSDQPRHRRRAGGQFGRRRQHSIWPASFPAVTSFA